MILVDTAIWVDHWRSRDEILAAMLLERRVVMHPFVIGEVALGSIGDREDIVASMRALPQLAPAHHAEVLRFIEAETLFGTGIGYIDAHLLAACRLTQGAKLWTRDKRLATVARRLNLAGGPPPH